MFWTANLPRQVGLSVRCASQDETLAVHCTLHSVRVCISIGVCVRDNGHKDNREDVFIMTSLANMIVCCGTGHRHTAPNSCVLAHQIAGPGTDFVHNEAPDRVAHSVMRLMESILIGLSAKW